MRSVQLIDTVTGQSLGAFFAFAFFWMFSSPLDVAFLDVMGEIKHPSATCLTAGVDVTAGMMFCPLCLGMVGL